MPNSDDAFVRHNPALTEAMAQVDRSMESVMTKAMYGREDSKDVGRPNRDAILYSQPDNVMVMLQNTKSLLDDLEYRRDVLLTERSRIEELIQDISYTIEVQRNVLNSAPPAPTTAGALRGAGSKAY